MRQVAKYACPVFVLLGLLIFAANNSKFILPVAFEIAGMGALYLLCKPLRDHASSAALSLFWLAPIALFWLISERREGREVSAASIGIEICLAGIGTSLLLAKNGLSKKDGMLVFAMLLTWAVAYFSGSSGGADKMQPMFGFMGLTGEQVWALIVCIRKILHVTFYGSLTYFLAKYLWNDMPNRRHVYVFAVAFPMCISICDEFRQSMMPNRQGSVLDVLLDMSATFFVLFLLAFLNKRKTAETP